MKKSMFLSISLSISLCSLIAAGVMAAETPSAPAAPAAAVEKSSPEKSPGHSAMPAASSSAASETPAASAPVPLAGKVLQTMNAGGYTYIYIEQANGKKTWVAVTETSVKVGARMRFKPGTEMEKFESKALKRTFDTVIFSDGVLSGAATSTADAGKGQGVSPGSRGAVKEKTAKIAVTKASGPNAVTVAEAYSNSAKLNKKKVVVRGQVVKVSSGIMNKNWIHIQDGTGSEKNKTHNLVCTSSKDMADVGDVVTISGTLVKDRDFGSGYKYAVIIEDGKISK
ncbi:MAG: DNA-binding protein [Desulfuromonadales bacterium]|nr:DNA-binding protein [Desulfuromonadales bacterium]